MLNLTISTQLHRKINIKNTPLQLISTRPLTKKEIVTARELGVKRYYLPCLNESESEMFFREFDKFWDDLIKPFNSDHFFWRNVVSSKMQEWERSSAYLALSLFAISQKADKEPQSIVILCSSLAEEKVCEEWGRKEGWNVFRKYRFPLPFLLRQLFQEINNVKNFLHMFTVCLYKKWVAPRYLPDTETGNNQILISSLFYDTCFKNGSYTDPFFGDLHKIIRKNGKYVKYLAGHLGNYRKSTKRLMKNGPVFILIPYSLISWAELITLGFKLFLRRLRVSKKAFNGCDFSNLIMWNARRFDYLLNFDSEIFFHGMTKLCRVETFERLIQLYEGNVFERACIQAFKKYNNQVSGYSHAVVYPLNLKIRLTENEKKIRPEPDILISTGEENRNLMAQIGNRDSATLISGCSLRGIPNTDGITTFEGDAEASCTDKSDILVALDGVWSCVTVLDWLMEQRDILEGFNVILRGHPNVPIDKLLSQCINELPGNFQLSNGDLLADIGRSFCVIYRQSSVGLQALMNGIPVIHLNVDSPLNSDPIVNLSDFKWVVNNEQDLSGALNEIQAANSNDKISAMENAKEYSMHYFSAPDSSAIDFFYR